MVYLPCCTRISCLFLDSADFAKCNGEIIGGVNAPISAGKDE